MTHRSALLTFPKIAMDKPVVSRVIRTCDVEVNIMQAFISPLEDGRMFAIFSGDEEAVDRAFAMLAESSVQVYYPTRNLWLDEELCVHCGACVAQCPSEALVMSSRTMEVELDGGRCTACGLCVSSCLYGALESIDEHLARRSGVKGEQR